jgi:hypothetical protein
MEGNRVMLVKLVVTGMDVSEEGWRWGWVGGSGVGDPVGFVENAGFEQEG